MKTKLSLTSYLLPLLKILSSVRINVVCLFLLFVLTFWGTVAQVHQGLYVAQERFFNSFFFLAGGFIPFPGAQLVLWVLFINLCATTITRFIHYKKPQQLGILIIHGGLLLYFAAAFVTFHLSKESYIHFMEGAGTNVSSSYFEWELAYWNKEGNVRRVTAYDAIHFKSGFVVPFSKVPWTISVDQFYANCAGFTKAMPVSNMKTINASGITLLEPRKLSKDRELNAAGGIFHLKTDTGKEYNILLFGTESKPTSVVVDGQTYYFHLQHKKFPLPFVIRLNKFNVDFHPGTNVAKSYESYVEIIKPGATREVRIFMNNPFRDKDYTFYQASYDMDPQGHLYSTLAVVKNGGRVLPYIACFTVFFGLLVHFIMAAFRSRDPHEIS